MGEKKDLEQQKFLFHIPSQVLCLLRGVGQVGECFLSAGKQRVLKKFKKERGKEGNGGKGRNSNERGEA